MPEPKKHEGRPRPKARLVTEGLRADDIRLDWKVPTLGEGG